MDTITLLLEKLDALDGRSDIVELSKTSGVPYNTILNIRKRVTPNPGVRTVDALLKTLKAKRFRAG